MIIKNGLVIDPASGLSEKMDLLIEDGIIKEMASLITKEGEEVLDAAGLVVAPGLIDTHVHFRDPGFTYKETIHTGALASAKGGFTSVICMANTSPTVDSVPVLKDNLSRASKEKIRIFQAASISCNLKGQEETDMDALKEAGACGFTDDGIPLLNAEFCFHAMEKAAKLNVPVSLHEEDPSFIRNNGISHGKVSDALGIYGSPSIAEESLVARDCMLALKSGADVVIQHISSGQSVELVRTFKAMGANLHAEATPHHFTLTDEAVLKYGALAGALDDIREAVGENTIVMSLMNGVDSEEIISTKIDKSHIIYSLIKVASHREGKEYVFNPETTIGIIYGEETAPFESKRVAAIRDLFDGTGLNYRVTEHIKEEIWSKYRLNICNNLPQAIIGAGVGCYTDSEHMKAISEGLRKEVEAVALAKGIDMSRCADNSSRGSAVPPTARYSTLQDIDAGRHTEIDMFSGAMMRMGKELGIDTPYNEYTYHMIKALEEKNDGVFEYQGENDRVSWSK